MDLKEELHKDILNFSSAYGDKLLNYQQLSTSYIINDSPEAPDIKFTYNQHGTSIMTDRFGTS